MTDLKPCPFCGGKPYLVNAAMAGCAYVVCTDCRMQGDDGSQERVIAAWNTRTPAPDVSGLVEALQAIIDRWDTPAWKDAEPTGAVIERARAVLAKWEGR